MICKRYVVNGHVQGVFFRVSAQEQAERLGVTGWVRNLPTGDVEVFACGTKETLHELSNWLWRGPPYAEVRKVTSELVEDVPPPTTFTVR